MACSELCKAKGVVPIALLLLLICSVARAPAAPPTQTPALEGQTFTFPWPPEWVARGKYQKMVLRGIIASNPGEWDVQACGTLPGCLMPSGPQFNGLVYHNPVNPDEIVCDLCESWTVSPDGKTYTFRLREAQWHDGQPVTAEDIKFSLDRITEPGAIRVRTGVLRMFYEHQSAEMLDAKTIRVPIKFASPLFLENLASEYMKMYPKHIAQGLSPEEAQQPGKLIGSGPWKLKEFKPNIAIEYVRNPNYFKKGLPFFEGMHFTIIRDHNRRLAAMQVGQAHTTEGPTIGTYGNEDPMRIQQETKGKVRAIYIPEAVQFYLTLHMNKPPFNDPRVRRAVFLAIDRQELVKIVRCAEPYGCFGSVGTFLPNKGGQVVESPEDLAQTPGWRQPKDQDIAAAKALMAAAGYTNGVKATLNLATIPGIVRHGEVIAEQLRKNLGLAFTLEAVDAPTVSPEQLQQLRQRLGLDRPIYVQYASWLWSVLRGDLGTSLWYKTPVWSQLQDRFLVTMELAVMAILLAFCAAVPLGITSAVKQDTGFDYCSRVFCVIGIALPTFWLGASAATPPHMQKEQDSPRVSCYPCGQTVGRRDRPRIGAVCPLVRLVSGVGDHITGDRPRPDPVWETAGFSVTPAPHGCPASVACSRRLP